MVKLENNMGGCIVCGRKLKYGEDIMRILYKGKVLFIKGMLSSEWI